MVRNFTLLLCVSFWATFCNAQTEQSKSIAIGKTCEVSTNHADCDVVELHIGGSGNSEKVVTHNGHYTLKKIDEPVTLEFRKPGYASVRRTFVRDNKAGVDNFEVDLIDRVVTVNTNLADAKIFANGAELGVQPREVVIPQGKSVTVEVKKPGFQTQQMIYYNIAGQEQPELSHFFTMENRLVQIKADPADAEIYAEHKKLGQGTADIIINKGQCVDVQVERQGFVSVKKIYCNRENAAPIPLTEEIKLKDRVITINAFPSDAKIFVNNAEQGTTPQSITITQGQSVTVEVKKPGYRTQTTTYYNMPGPT